MPAARHQPVLPFAARNKVLQGDCVALLRRVPDKSIQLIVSSPPYNIGKPYETRVPLDVYLQGQKQVLEECARVLADDGSIFWQVGAYSNHNSFVPLDLPLYAIIESLGLTIQNRIVWIRQHGLHATRRFSCRHEAILWLTKGEDYRFNLDAIRVPQKYPNKRAWRGERKGKKSGCPRGKNPGDVWAFANIKANHEERTIHPCQFPEGLVERVVAATTRPGDVVLDPYAGSGTVGAVAQQLGRHYLLMELQAKYVTLIRRRLSGKPNHQGSFPNLKILRRYAQAGHDIKGLSFDTSRSGTRPTVVGRIRPEPLALVESLQGIVDEASKPYFKRTRLRHIQARPPQQVVTRLPQRRR